MGTAVIIPARGGSTRFPQKPQTLIHGVSLIQRTWKIASSVVGQAQVWVATDDLAIARHVEAFGGQVVCDPKQLCHNGSERVFAAAQHLGLAPETLLINLQGDAVLTPPHVVAQLIALFQDPRVSSGWGTPAVALDPQAWAHFQECRKSKPTSGTFVVFQADPNRNLANASSSAAARSSPPLQGSTLLPQPHAALYFSKAVIPPLRPQEQPAGEELAAVVRHRHIGIYGYRLETLRRYVQLSPSALESAEGLEQLRALEHGIPVHVFLADYQGRTHWSVDYPSDVAIVEAIIEREGELVQ